MTSKEKSTELYNKYYKLYIHQNSVKTRKEIAIYCAKICVQYIIDFMTINLKWDEKHNGNIHYWQEVLNHLNEM